MLKVCVKPGPSLGMNCPGSHVLSTVWCVNAEMIAFSALDVISLYVTQFTVKTNKQH